MKLSRLVSFDPEMDSSAYSTSGTGEPDDFGFAFNDRNFSDRVLQIEVFDDDSPEPISGADGSLSLADWALYRKRPRADTKTQNALDITAIPEEHIIKCNHPDADDVAGDDNQDEEEFEMIEESPSGDAAGNGDDLNCELDSSRVLLRVKMLHISSPILAAKSPFFYKLFSNGTKELEKRHITIQINASDEAALKDLLNFMYMGFLAASTAPALLDVLMAAEKFEVASCMSYCVRALCKLPMTPESALLYLDLPSSVLMAESVQPLTDSARRFLTERYKDPTKFPDEVMSLPLAGLEAILASDDLQVASEDSVYDLMLKWARAHYLKLEERQSVLRSHLIRYVRTPYLSCRKLRKIQTCNDLDHEVASKLVLEALFFKAEDSHRQRMQAAAVDPSLTNHRYIERTYKYRPVKIIDFELPRQQCVVYLDLKREECSSLFPSGRVYSQAFHLGGQGFFLSAHCNMDQQNSLHCFGLFLGMQEKGSVTFAVDYELSARSKPTEEFVSKYKGTYTFTGGKAVGYRNLFALPWTRFIADDSPHFINDILHLKAELTLKQ